MERSSERIETLLNVAEECLCFTLHWFVWVSIHSHTSPTSTQALQILSRASASLAAAAVSPLRIAPQYSPNVTKSSKPEASLGLPSTAARRPRTSSAHACGLAHTLPPPEIPPAVVVARLAAPPAGAEEGAASWGESSAAT